MQFLNTKFHIPKITDSDGLVTRNRLIDDLNGAIDKRLVLIQAPAGFGKTTLISQWFGEKPMGLKECWLSIDIADNNPVRLWSYVCNAFNRAHPGLCQSALFQLQASDKTGIEETLISVINSISDSDRRFILVLDDFHLITQEKIFDQFSFFLDHPIENLLIVISSREKPGIELSRLRVSGSLFELNASHLKFTQTEMHAYLRISSDAPLPIEQEQQLFQTTEGWIAAIKLAALSSGSRPAGPGPGKLLIHDYLMEEVFAGLPKPLQSFLQDVSICDRFCLSLCRHLTENPDADAMLDNVARHRLFLIPLDNDGIWYRFHHLFLHFLRTVLEKQTDQAGITALHIKAFQWFQDNHSFDEAFSHALAAGRDDLAARLLAEQISKMFGEGGEEILASYFKQLSASAVMRNPVLAGYYLGFKIFSGDFDTIDTMKDLYETGFSKKYAAVFKGFYLTAKAYEVFYVSGDLQKAVLQGQEAIDHLPPAHEAIIRMLEYMQTISYRYSGRIKPALALCKPKKTDNVLMAGMAATSRADIDLEMGHLKSARQVIAGQVQALESIFGNSTPPALFGFAYIILGKVLKEEFRLKEAQESFSRGISIIRNSDMIELIVISYGEYSHFLTCCGEYAKAREMADRALRMARQNLSWVETLLLAQKNRIRLKEKKPDRVAPWAKQYPVNKNMKIPFIRSIEYLTVARYLIESGQFNKAVYILDSLIKKDLEDDRRSQLMESLVLKSKAVYLSGDGDRAAALLKEACDLARDQGHVTVFLYDSQGMEPVFKQCMAKGFLPDHLIPHLLFLNTDPENNRETEVIVHNFVEVLNKRELDILKLFKKGLSNKEAADMLCLSVNTVRWYASRLFAKLDVKRRGQAVSRAEDLKLI